MAGLPQSTAGKRGQIAEVRVWDRVAGVSLRLWGVISLTQLFRCGMSSAAVSRWVRSGRLHRLYPRVYAVGRSTVSIEGRLAAALLYAGPGAALSHGVAAWWWQLREKAPTIIDVATPHRRRPQRGLRLHYRPSPHRIFHRRLPVTPVPRTLLDLAPLLTHRQLRRALAEADYRRLLDVDAVRTQLGPGRPGSAALRRALDHHLPLLAKTATEIEQLFIELCEAHDIPLPEVNVPVCGFKVDALWRELRLVVELDGGPAHSSPAQMYRDRERDLTLRTAGYRVVRYTWHQVVDQGERVAADLLTQIFPTPIPPARLKPHA